MPRFVFFDNQAGNNFLIYAKCADVQCTPSTMTYSFIDEGTAVSLPDKQVTLKGSVIAYGSGLSGIEQSINLERDLFGESLTKPGEIFTFEPKYYSIFREIIKEPIKLNEPPP